MKTGDIEFTQFLFPDGRKTPVTITRPFEIAEMADALKKEGFSFETENDNGKIWLTIINHGTDKVFDRFCINGPAVPDKVDEIVIEAFAWLVKP